MKPHCSECVWSPLPLTPYYLPVRSSVLTLSLCVYASECLNSCVLVLWLLCLLSLLSLPHLLYRKLTGRAMQRWHPTATVMQTSTSKFLNHKNKNWWAKSSAIVFFFFFFQLVQKMVEQSKLWIQIFLLFSIYSFSQKANCISIEIKGFRSKLGTNVPPSVS